MDSLFNIPRYQENPVIFLFEAYILDLIGYLPEESAKGIEALELGDRLDLSSDSWKEAVSELLDLPLEIEAAVQEKWFLQLHEKVKTELVLDPILFAQEYVDQYFGEGVEINWGTEAEKQQRLRNLHILRSIYQN